MVSFLRTFEHTLLIIGPSAIAVGLGLSCCWLTIVGAFWLSCAPLAECCARFFDEP